jgi:hypothetical protein
VAITITREQRDAIHQELLTELTGSGDIWAELQSGDYDAAKRTRRRFEDEMRLLDDIGWEPDQKRGGVRAHDGSAGSGACAGSSQRERWRDAS